MKTQLLFLTWLTCLLCLLSLNPQPVHAQVPAPIVHAVLFYSPTCGHCQYVRTEVLPPLFEQYGDRLQIYEVNVTSPEGQNLFLSALAYFNLDRSGVPFLVIGDQYLVGSIDIPEQFPGLIESGLARGGVGWPAIPGLAVPTPEPTSTPVPVVQAVLFYQSMCGHCKQLIEEIMPPLFQQYGSQLQVFGLDIYYPEGDALYHAAIAQFNIQLIGVPTLIVGERVLVGVEIQQEFPAMIEELLAQGGIGWPEFPGLPEALVSAQATATPAPVSSTEPPALTATPGLILAEPYSTGLGARLLRDPFGNAAALLVLAGMVAAFIAGGLNFFRKPARPAARTSSWVIPLLCLVGLGVAGYLTYAETTRVQAFCGPVGDCNTVQQSDYARLFGILPIGVVGMAGYLLILVAWGIGKFSSGRVAGYAALAMLGMAGFGTAFSIYLTFLEPFVIGATCIWCLTSAVLTTVLMLLAIPPGRKALDEFM